MNNEQNSSRRNFLRLGGAFASAAAFSRFGMMNALAQTTPNYKALVCVFMFGGNDSHNMVVPQTQSEYNAYKSIRGTLALPDTNAKLLPVSALNGTPYALSDGLASIQPLWAQQKLAAVANVGMLVQPTSRAQYLAGTATVPTNLFSHSDQVIQMQAANPNGSGGTGWAGRVADAVQSMNGAASFPASVSMSGSALFCTGNVVQSASLIPGFDLSLDGMSAWPASATAARQQALQEILTFDTGLALVQAADKVRQDALSLNAMLSFYNSTIEMGIANQVTTFTESDFGRTLQPSGTGSDHGWGSHHLVLGGAVKGGDLYGKFPAMALGGPDDANTRGVLIPSTSVDQYGATMAKWFGVSAAAMPTVFPTILNFSTADLGFLG